MRPRRHALLLRYVGLLSPLLSGAAAYGLGRSFLQAGWPRALAVAAAILGGALAGRALFTHVIKAECPTCSGWLELQVDDELGRIDYFCSRCRCDVDGSGSKVEGSESRSL